MYERAFMEEELDGFDFVLARSLHMTVARMRAEMGNDEYLAWRAFYVYEKAMLEMGQP